MMMFQLFDADEIETGRFHFVICLDQSGSMSGSNWETLMRVYVTFIKSEGTIRVSGMLCQPSYSVQDTEHITPWCQSTRWVLKSVLTVEGPILTWHCVGLSRRYGTHAEGSLPWSYLCQTIKEVATQWPQSKVSDNNTRSLSVTVLVLVLVVIWAPLHSCQIREGECNTPRRWTRLRVLSVKLLLVVLSWMGILQSLVSRSQGWSWLTTVSTTCSQFRMCVVIFSFEGKRKRGTSKSKRKGNCSFHPLPSPSSS